MAYEILLADYHNPAHAEALATLLAAYSADPMGGGEALPEVHCLRAAQALADFGNAFTVLAFAAEGENREPVALANCLVSFSTFSLKPLINIHDFFVASHCRGTGLASRLLDEVAREAGARGCTKLTLEVLNNNVPAKELYSRFGFAPYELSPGAGAAEFWQMYLT